jgi:hypothetical protein
VYAAADGTVPGVPLASFLDGLWYKVSGPLSGVMSNPNRMIQVGAIGMLLALMLIWRRK